MRGCNLGNWLLIEPWMFGIFDDALRDQHTFVSILRERFGDARAHELMELHRAGWVTARDMEMIRSFGLELVRLPFHYALLEGDEAFTLRDDAFRWLDAGVEMAHGAGLRVVLDMHGVPGGQSVDAPTGRLGVNTLWDDARAQRRTAWLWARIAERYRDHAAVVGYDIINEPYGDFASDHHDTLIGIVGFVHDAIREVDRDTVIYAPGTLRGVGFYGDPAARGWHNTGLTDHFYPGIFAGETPSLAAHSIFWGTEGAEVAALVERTGAPFLLGEFNPVFERSGGAAMLRAWFERADALGWHTTMWSYKLLRPLGSSFEDAWGLVTNAEPVSIDPRTSSEAEIEAAFVGWADMPLGVDAGRRAMIGGWSEVPDLIRALPLPGDAAGAHAARVDAVAVGDSPIAKAWSDSGGAVTLLGGGSDLWGTHDGLALLPMRHGAGGGERGASCVLEAFDAMHRHAKAGVMLRGGTDAGDAHVTVHAMPDGRLLAAWRGEAGGLTHERVLGIGAFPVGLRLAPIEGGVMVGVTRDDGAWVEHRLDVVAPGGADALAAVFVMSHLGGVAAAARFSGLGDAGEGVGGVVAQRGTIDGATALDARMWQLGDGFVHPGDFPASGDTGRCGDEVLEARLDAVVGDGVISAQAALVAGGTSGGWWRFEVWAQVDEGEAGGALGKIEMRVDGEVDGLGVTLGSAAHAIEEVASDGAWSRLRVDGPAFDAARSVHLEIKDAGSGAGRLRFCGAQIGLRPSLGRDACVD